VGKGAKPDVSIAAQGGSINNKNKKNADGNNQSLAGAPTIIAATVAVGSMPFWAGQPYNSLWQLPIMGTWS
jgi:hypothetical protein